LATPYYSPSRRATLAFVRCSVCAFGIYRRLSIKILAGNGQLAALVSWLYWLAGGLLSPVVA
jgi:hypothetical protein